MRIDAHHHVWRYTAAEYGWIDDTMAPLRRDFLVPDLEAELSKANVDTAITVQARQTIEETTWLLDLANSTAKIAAVVGWLPIADSSFPAHLEKLRSHPKLKGLRHIIQSEPAGFLDDPAFNRGIARLNGLTYDILIFAHQLTEATRFVDRHPNQPFILDHIAKPRIAAGEIKQWSIQLRELARRPNVTCKLSGMVTEADPHNWSPAQLKPYFEVTLEAFTPHRLMIGTDWPVCLLGCTYAQWWQTVETWIAPLTSHEQSDILGQTATRAYNLKF